MTLEEAASQIKEDNWFLVSLKPSKIAKFSLPFLTSSNRFSALERIIFTDHLAAMFRAGTPIVDALETYQDEGNKSGGAILESLVASIRQGKKLSEALASFPSTFSPLYRSLVQSGELTGNLDETVSYLAKELRREYEFREKIKSALFYPVIVLVVAFLVIILLVLVVIPRILQVTQSLSGDLPFMTRVVGAVASFLMRFGPFLGGLFILSMVSLVFLLRSRQMRRKLEPYFLRIPLVGKIIKKYILNRFLRVMGSCLKYGVPFGAAFEIIYEVVGNITYQEACRRVSAKVTKGLSLSSSLGEENTQLFPRMIVRTLKGAEKTGTVDEAMSRLSQFYEDDIDRSLKRITEMIEPALVIVLGVIVLAIAISVVAPIYQMTSRIK